MKKSLVAINSEVELKKKKKIREASLHTKSVVQKVGCSGNLSKEKSMQVKERIWYGNNVELHMLLLYMHVFKA